MGERVMYEYKATILEVVDGDSVKTDLDLGCGVRIRMAIRLDGIDAPEVVGESRATGLAARDHLVSLISNKTVFVATRKDKAEKYGRLLGTFFLTVEDKIAGRSVNQAMVEAGHARPYEGGGKR